MGGEASELFDRAQADPISLAESAIDGAGLRHAHLGAADQRRHIRWISVAIANEAARATTLVDGSPEDPTALVGSESRPIGHIRCPSTGYAELCNEARVRYIPSTVQKTEISSSN